MKEGFVEGVDGLIFVGKYSLKMRMAYFDYRIEKYLIDHPGSTIKQAMNYTRAAWKQKAERSMYVTNK